MGYNINEYGEIVAPKDTEMPQDECSYDNQNKKKNWFVCNYNWLWLIGLLAQIAFCLSVSACGVGFEFEYDYEFWLYSFSLSNIEVMYYNMSGVLACIILAIYITTWIWNKNRKNNFISSFIWLILVGCTIFSSIYYMLLYDQGRCQAIIMFPCVFALSLWVLAISLSSGLK